MRTGTYVRLLILGMILTAATACVDFTYSSTGRTWTIRAGETINSDCIRARRSVTFRATGDLEAGIVTVSVLRDGLAAGQPLSIQAGSVDMKVEYAHLDGLWSFRAQADGDARGELYLSINDM